MSDHFPGIADELFVRGDIPMTKQEVRILALSKACIAEQDIVIDIGAGTGSLSVEAALLARRGKVFAVEREEEGTALIRTNAAKFAVDNIEIIAGEAPGALAGLPAADVIFVGGSGGHLATILAEADRLLKPGGRLVITAVTVETLQQALEITQQRSEYKVEATGVQITRLRRAGSKNMFQALNPVYLIACNKGGHYDR
ncbi:MAG: precorrin-6Y C5,15-methyltransferase (decarboxylating) subunit CbiT [Negativicutes bacterium]|nr:precorrin-6Y C5,15-methyltransferase (decarboxylating) subunit CbiT [Negativicutes bacterium]